MKVKLTSRIYTISEKDCYISMQVKGNFITLLNERNDIGFTFSMENPDKKRWLRVIKLLKKAVEMI